MLLCSEVHTDRILPDDWIGPVLALGEVGAVGPALLQELELPLDTRAVDVEDQAAVGVGPGGGLGGGSGPGGAGGGSQPPG